MPAGSGWASLNQRADSGAGPSCLALGRGVMEAEKGLGRGSLTGEVAGVGEPRVGWFTRQG